MATVSITDLMQINLENTKCFVQMLFDNMQRQISELRDESSDLKRSLEYAHDEIEDLKELTSSLRNQINSNQTGTLTDLENRTRNLEDKSRAKNLRISGLREVSEENNEQTTHLAEKFIQEKLEQENVQVKKAYRVGPTGPNPRQVIVRMHSTDDKIKCLKSSKNLKGTTLYINEDVSPATAAIRRQKLDALKQKRAEGFVAYFVGTEIVAKRRISSRGLTAHSSQSNIVSPATTVPPTPTTPSRTVATPAASSVSPTFPGTAALAPNTYTSPLTATATMSTATATTADVTTLVTTTTAATVAPSTASVPGMPAVTKTTDKLAPKPTKNAPPGATRSPAPTRSAAQPGGRGGKGRGGRGRGV